MIRRLIVIVIMGMMVAGCVAPGPVVPNEPVADLGLVGVQLTQDAAAALAGVSGAEIAAATAARAATATAVGDVERLVNAESTQVANRATAVGVQLMVDGATAAAGERAAVATAGAPMTEAAAWQAVGATATAVELDRAERTAARARWDWVTLVGLGLLVGVPLVVIVSTLRLREWQVDSDRQQETMRQVMKFGVRYMPDGTAVMAVALDNGAVGWQRMGDGQGGELVDMGDLGGAEQPVTNVVPVLEAGPVAERVAISEEAARCVALLARVLDFYAESNGHAYAREQAVIPSAVALGMNPNSRARLTKLMGHCWRPVVGQYEVCVEVVNGKGTRVTAAGGGTVASLMRRIRRGELVPCPIGAKGDGWDAE